SALKDPPVFLLEESDVRGRIAPRKPDGHKGSYGHLLVVAGSRGKTGAAAMAALAALRSGAGLVTVATRAEALAPAMAHAPELMGHELPGAGPLALGDLDSLRKACDGKSALVIGPGIPRGPDTGELLGALFEAIGIPVVVDADGLNALAGDLSPLGKARASLL